MTQGTDGLRDTYRMAAADRLREAVAGTEPRPGRSEHDRRYDELALLARGLTELADALGLASTETFAEIRRRAEVPSKQAMVDSVLARRAADRTEALRQASSPGYERRGDGSHAPTPGPDDNAAADRAAFMAGRRFSQAELHARMAKAGHAGDAGSADFVRDLRRREQPRRRDDD